MLKGENILKEELDLAVKKHTKYTDEISAWYFPSRGA